LAESIEKKWWKEAVVYQIYPRSFQDSNGDGIGDIPGIISRLDELAALGAGVIWLSPVYPSPDADNGYDISDYRNIDPKFGTLADMDRLVAGARQRGIRIIMDLVINHTSDEHEWFQKSRSPSSPYRDYYIWKPAGKNGALPNNWNTFFMEKAWEFDPQSGEYYLHLFDKKQPDLNYHNPAVLGEIKDILRFWLDRGIAGFRCDVINLIYKNSFANGKAANPIRGMEHYKTNEGTHKVLREIRSGVLDNYDCFTVGEAVMTTLNEARDLTTPDRKELDMVFTFEHLETDRVVSKYISKRFSAGRLLKTISKWQQGLEWNAVYLENHDQPRIVSHYGDDGPFWERSAKLLALMEFTLRGTPFIYQGQEIGMTNFDFTGIDDINDVESKNMNRLMKRLHIPAKLRWKWIAEASRDNSRTPMQWSARAGAGFSSGKPWLGINHNHVHINYASQRDNPESILNFYKTLVRLRGESDTLKYGTFTPLYRRGGVIAWRRELSGESYTAVFNCSIKSARFFRHGTNPFDGEIVLSNTGRTTIADGLLPWEAVLLKTNSVNKATVPSHS
jgi:oligo-1,6-glucosidase